MLALRSYFSRLMSAALIASVISACTVPQKPLSPPRPAAALRSATATAPALQPTASPLPPTATPALLTQSLVSTLSLEQRLQHSPMIPRDPELLARELGAGAAPSKSGASPAAASIGECARFWVCDVEASQYREITATLRVVSDHVEMWLEDGTDVPDADLKRSVEILEDELLPVLHSTFGVEATPGIDANPRMTVLNANISGAAGYFSSANEHSMIANRFSNEREMLVMNVRALDPGSDAYDAVLAHEIQHMIHWNMDPNEDTWLNEGASELAEDICGYGWSAATVGAFSAQPDTQLTNWEDDTGSTAADYGASYLWMRYLYDQLGASFISSLVSQESNGMQSVQVALDDRTAGISSEDLYAQWLVANLADALDVSDDRYRYETVDLALSPITVTVESATYGGPVHQFAADYIELALAQASTVTVSFRGDPLAELVPNRPASGDYQWWSNRGDSSHSYLERVFDLRGVAQAALEFSLWHDIEYGWDYGHVRVSVDDGQTWTLLRGEHMTDYDPNGNALGSGYTGTSGSSNAESAPSWTQERIDLGDWVGQQVLIRFDLLTDDAVNRPGLCLDDISVSAIDFFDDVETGEGDWRGVGFIRHDNRLRQRWLVQAVAVAGQKIEVTRLEVADDGAGDWQFTDIGGGAVRLFLVVSAMAPKTTERARYQLSLESVDQTGAQ